MWHNMFIGVASNHHCSFSKPICFFIKQSCCKFLKMIMIIIVKIISVLRILWFYYFDFSMENNNTFKNILLCWKTGLKSFEIFLALKMQLVLLHKVILSIPLLKKQKKDFWQISESYNDIMWYDCSSHYWFYVAKLQDLQHFYLLPSEIKSTRKQYPCLIDTILLGTRIMFGMHFR